MAVIGIVGFAGAGKGTVGDILIKEYGYRQDSFAAPLKDQVATIFGWPRHLLEGDTVESREWRDIPDTWWEERIKWEFHPLYSPGKRFTPRFALQLFGTEVVRQGFMNDMWIASLERRLIDNSPTVITDCRFPNEIRAIREMGGIVVRVVRGHEPIWFDSAERVNSGVGSSRDEAVLEQHQIHQSERAWIGQEFDAVISNNGTLDDLKEAVKCLLQNQAKL